MRNTIERAVLLASGRTITELDVAVSGPRAAPSPTGGLPFPTTIAELSQAAARRMLELSGGNKTDAARRLGISRPRLHRLLNATLSELDSAYADDDADV
jgi:two-component system response regulator HydG